MDSKVKYCVGFLTHVITSIVVALSKLIYNVLFAVFYLGEYIISCLWFVIFFKYFPTTLILIPLSIFIAFILEKYNLDLIDEAKGLYEYYLKFKLERIIKAPKRIVNYFSKKPPLVYFIESRSYYLDCIRQKSEYSATNTNKITDNRKVHVAQNDNVKELDSLKLPFMKEKNEDPIKEVYPKKEYNFEKLKNEKHNSDNDVFIPQSIKQKRIIKLEKKNWLEIAQRKIEIGKAGELFVVDYEKSRLIKEGKNNLAKKIIHVAQELGDGYGYDILSFNSQSQKIFIEVKSTSGKSSNPIIMTKNERKVMSEERESYCLYRISELNTESNSACLEKYVGYNEIVKNFSIETETVILTKK